MASGISLVTRGMITDKGDIITHAGGGYYGGRDEQIAKPTINITKIKTSSLKSQESVNINDITFKIEKVITTN